MSQRIRVQNENMVRDPRTSALLSTDKDAIKAYERRKQELQSQKDRLNRLERDVATLKDLVSQLMNQR